MKHYLSIVVLAVSLLQVGNALHPDASRTTCEIAIARGFGCEFHRVKSQGYIIELHRIRFSYLNLENANRAPVILQPGLLSTSSSFVIASDVVSFDKETIGQNMGFELAKQGYDVWLSNNRGNQYAMKHESIKPSTEEFWNFTFDQMAEFDIPAIIDYVCAKTGHSKVGYVGHSQGTTVMFAQLSSSAHYNEIVKPFIAISPVTRIGSAQTLGRVFLDSLIRDGSTIIPWFKPNLGVFTSPAPRELIQTFCESDAGSAVCSLILSQIVGQNDKQLNMSRLTVYASHFLSSTSFHNMLHISQLLASNEFKRFDFGLEINRQVYGQNQPPIYNLRKITHKAIHLIHGLNDYCVPLDGLKELQRDLSTFGLYQVSDPNCNHIDPLIGIDISVEVNKQVIKLLNHYYPRQQ